jgi:hypothetical protein
LGVDTHPNSRVVPITVRSQREVERLHGRVVERFE